jgi:hypothetical protein
MTERSEYMYVFFHSCSQAEVVVLTVSYKAKMIEGVHAAQYTALGAECVGGEPIINSEWITLYFIMLVML